MEKFISVGGGGISRRFKIVYFHNFSYIFFLIFKIAMWQRFDSVYTGCIRSGISSVCSKKCNLKIWLSKAYFGRLFYWIDSHDSGIILPLHTRGSITVNSNFLQENFFYDSSGGMRWWRTFFFQVFRHFFFF